MNGGIYASQCSVAAERFDMSSYKGELVGSAEGLEGCRRSEVVGELEYLLADWREHGQLLDRGTYPSGEKVAPGEVAAMLQHRLDLRVSMAACRDRLQNYTD
jgi:hypothetical protein